MAKIFISYDRASKDVVKQLVEDLTDDGVEIWFDRHLTGGQDWWDNILSAIRECEIFVAALTPEFLESKACQRELKYAIDLQKILLPVRLSNKLSADSLPSHLSRRQWEDYSLRSVEAFRSLQRALRNLPKAPPLPDPLPDAPPAPISYLSSLRAKVDADSQLKFQDQIQLVFELRQQFRKGDPAKDILDLLQRLRRRDDLFARVSQDIDDLFRDIDGGRSGEKRIEPAAVEQSVSPAEPPATDQPVTLPLHGAALGLTGSGGAGEAANDELHAQEPRPTWMTGKLFGAVVALAVMLAGTTFGYFYLRQTEKSERSQTQASTSLPSAESAPSNPPLVQPPEPTVTPEKPSVRPAEPAPAKVLATVNGKPITEDDLKIAADDLRSSLSPQLEGKSRDTYLINFLIDEELVAQKALAEKVDQTPEFAKKLADYREKLLTESTKADQTPEFAKKLAYYRKKLLMESLLADVAKTAATDAAIKAAYDKAAKDQKPQTEIHALHILVGTKQEAEAAAKRLMAGEEFAHVAKSVSKDPGAEGGDLGWFTRDRMVPEFADAAFKLEVGQVSDPVKTPYGWHIIEVVDKREKTFPLLGDVKDQVARYVVKKAQAAMIADLRKNAKIEWIFPISSPQ